MDEIGNNFTSGRIQSELSSFLDDFEIVNAFQVVVQSAVIQPDLSVQDIVAVCQSKLHQLSFTIKFRTFHDFFKDLLFNRFATLALILIVLAHPSVAAFGFSLLVFDNSRDHAADQRTDQVWVDVLHIVKIFQTSFSQTRIRVTVRTDTRSAIRTNAINTFFSVQFVPVDTTDTTVASTDHTFVVNVLDTTLTHLVLDSVVFADVQLTNFRSFNTDVNVVRELNLTEGSLTVSFAVIFRAFDAGFTTAEDLLTDEGTARGFIA